MEQQKGGRLYIIKICFLILFCYLYSSCTIRQSNYKCIMPKGAELKAGDVVFRRGGGFTSQVVLAADRKGNYSHTGIVVEAEGKKMIVHAVPGEHDFDGDVDRVKMDTPERFFSSEYASIGEICRSADSLAAINAALEAYNIYKRNVLFDHDYNDADTTKMYCTELIVHAFKKAGVTLVGPERHEVRLPILRINCIFPSDIHESPYLETVLTF